MVISNIIRVPCNVKRGQRSEDHDKEVKSARHENAVLDSNGKRFAVKAREPSSEICVNTSSRSEERRSKPRQRPRIGVNSSVR
jgi:hypothetical protein